ncbi:MAG: MerR family transcriptional regulator [Nannocystaceae bacterium]|nr:MerR family transcriptional regulator [Nannocystaceae bacterium]
MDSSAPSRGGRTPKASRSKTPAARAGAATRGDDVDLGSDKLYFKIGEVAAIVGVEPYVLRYWESEFSAVRPQKSRTQQRVYRRRDVITLLRIKHLLYEKKFTIAGARAELREPLPKPEREAAAAGGVPEGMARPQPGYLARQSLARVRALLDEVRSFVHGGDAEDPARRRAADPAAYVSRRGGARGLLEVGPDEPTPPLRPGEPRVR